MSLAKLVPVFLFILASAVHALDAKAIYAKVAPSTVLIEDLDTQGSGVVLTQDGLILTNLHVVAAHIALKVKLQVKFGNNTALTEIDEVQVMKIHPKYDLALLKATPPANGTFIPAQMLPKETPLATGSKCYAIGNPGGLDGKTLELSITEGLVSSAKREIEGQEFVQISAALNHGNSGGPVCDESGRVFGIATWKLENTEGIGFAIPAQKLVLSDFVAPLQKKENFAEMKRAEDAGREFYNLSLRLTGLEREKSLYLSASCYHLMAEAAPNRPEPIYNLALTFIDLGQPDVAKKYLEALLKRAPEFSPAYHMMGITLMNESKDNREKAMQLWWKGIETGKPGMEQCLDDIMVTMANQEKYAAAAYMLQWSQSLAVKTNSPQSNRADVWAGLSTKMPPDDLATIRRMKSGFSRADFELLEAGKPVSALSGILSKAAASTPEAPMMDASQVAAMIKRASERFAPQLVGIPDKVMALPLPDEPRVAMLANVGWQLVMHFPNLGKLGVFNLAAGKFDGYIDCPDPEALFATGGNVLILYLPSTGMTELYDLNSLEKKVSKRCVFPGYPRFLGMGLLNPLRIFVLCEPNKEFPGVSYHYTAAVIALPDLTCQPVALSAAGSSKMHMTVMAGDALDGGMDETATHCAVRRLRTSPNGLCHYVLQPGNMASYDYNHRSLPKPCFSSNSVYIISPRNILNTEGGTDLFDKINQGARVEMVAPVAGMSAFIEKYRDESNRRAFTGFRVRTLPAMTVAAEVSTDKVSAEALTGHELSAFTQLFASSYSDRMAYILQKKKKLFLFPLGLRAGTGGDGPVKPGGRFERKLDIAAGAAVKVENGPKGLVYDAEKSSLVWDVPSDFPTGQVLQVILLVTAADGKTEYKIEKISIP